MLAKAIQSVNDLCEVADSMIEYVADVVALRQYFVGVRPRGLGSDCRMFTVVVEAGFNAVHRLRRRDGTQEPVHGHDWQVRAHFCAERLDDSGMVVDFENARTVLDSVLSTLHHANLNEKSDFVDRNPTAEVVASYVLKQIAKSGMPQIRRVEVTEAPFCTAVFEVNEPAASAE